jgi:hypothetical protein
MGDDWDWDGILIVICFLLINSSSENEIHLSRSIHETIPVRPSRLSNKDIYGSLWRINDYGRYSNNLLL